MNYPKGGYRGYGRGGRDGWRFSTIRSSRQETRGITESKSGCRNDSPYTVTEVVFSPRIVLHIPWEGPSTLFKLFSVLNPFGVSCQVGMTRLLSLYVIVGIRTTPYLPHQGLWTSVLDTRSQLAVSVGIHYDVFVSRSPYLSGWSERNEGRGSRRRSREITGLCYPSVSCSIRQLSYVQSNNLKSRPIFFSPLTKTSRLTSVCRVEGLDRDQNWTGDSSLRMLVGNWVEGLNRIDSCRAWIEDCWVLRTKRRGM